MGADPDASVIGGVAQGEPCTCGRTGLHGVREHDAEIVERAEQAAGVPDAGELVAADEVLVVNLYRNGIGDPEALYAKVIARVPSLANRILFLDAEGMAVIRGAARHVVPPAAVEVWPTVDPTTNHQYVPDNDRPQCVLCALPEQHYMHVWNPEG